jgi:ribokinase
MRIAVIGHVEHVTVAAVPALPTPGEILHLEHPIFIAAGGGGIAFSQFVRSPAELHLFTALGNDDAASVVERHILATSAHIHAARCDEPHTRDLVLVTPDGERTILVVGEPLHPRHDDPLPWEMLAECDAAYFTAQDPEILRLARSARFLAVTARRSEALGASGVRADVVVGSAVDPREARLLADYAVPPNVLVMTEGRRGGTIETADGITRFAAPPSIPVVGAYGAGDSFAAALTWYLARDVPVPEACDRAARHGAAVLAGINPLEHQIPLD